MLRYEHEADLVAKILALTLAERIELVEAIWDRISCVPEALPLAEWQKEELDLRLAEYESDPDAGSYEIADNCLGPPLTKTS